MITCPFLLHALSPLHAGTGHAADVIDLPTARYKATGIPFVPGSSIKGVLRDARRAGDRDKTEAVFGPSDDPAAHAGALVVGDARLLALPVRSFRGTFAWTTSPLLLTLARRDLGDADLPFPPSRVAARSSLTEAAASIRAACTSRTSICPQPSRTKRLPGRGDSRRSRRPATTSLTCTLNPVQREWDGSGARKERADAQDPLPGR